MTKKQKTRKLTHKTRALASKFIAEEIKTGKYPRKQAVAIGISRARTEASAARRRARISGMIKRYR